MQASRGVIQNVAHPGTTMNFDRYVPFLRELPIVSEVYDFVGVVLHYSTKPVPPVAIISRVTVQRTLSRSTAHLDSK